MFAIFSFSFGFLIAVIISTITFVLLFKRRRQDLEKRTRVLTALRRMDEVMMSTLGLNNVAQLVTDAVVVEMKIDMGVLGLVDKKKDVLRRVAMSNTQSGKQARQLLPMPYNQVDIPLNWNANYTIKAVNTGQIQVTNSLFSVLSPTIDEATCNKIQIESGLKTFLVYPLSVRGEVQGMMILSFKKELPQITAYEKDAYKKLVDTMGIALDSALLYENLKATTQQLKYANTRLKELDKLKDDFVSIASHELRTPMTAIRSYSWMALNRSDVPLSEKLKKYIGRTLISTERLINLVNDMLNISRIESGRVEITPQPFDLALLVTDVLAEVDVKAKEKGLHMQHTNANIPRAFADPDKVHQVLLNLVGNAIKFTPENGLITISFFSDGLTVEASVKDSGVGITKEDQSKLFTKFGRLDNSYVAAATSGGTGLGLYICKNLIELMGGKIWASSEGPGKGTVFTFSLPVANSKTVSEAAKYTNRVEGGAKMLEPVTVQSVT